MRKIFLILLCFLTAFILSCGGNSESSGSSCESNFDCPIGQTCSAGRCITPGSSDNGSGNGSGNGDGNGDGNSDGGNGSQNGGNSSGDDGDSSTDDEPAEYDDGPITGACEPGKVQKCEYQGDPVTENVGACKAATRTCKEDGTWGYCEGAVEPVYESGEELCTNGIDDDCDGNVDNKKGSCIIYWGSDDTGDTDTDTDSGIIDVGYTGSYSDAYQLPDELDAVCNDTCVPLKAECLDADINENEAGLCNGLDDDCDGKVDEGCSCDPGQTQPCFLGPKNYRNKGTCRDGVQTCKVTMRASKGVWGDCVGGISPSLDVCDNADNNCNGCDDDKLCCQPPIDCAYDIGTASPFADKIIDGNQIYDKSHQFNDADTATWEWTLSQGPCDIVLNKVNSYAKAAKTQSELGTFAESDRKTVVSGVGFSQFKVKFRLSGSYKLHLKVTRPNGEVHECEWIIKVVSEGLRIELCWDTNTKVDVDLHMGKNGGTTSTWTNGACYFSSKNPDWGYPTTANYDKDGNWQTSMNNPRLDIDNIANGAIPENINIDNPKDGDVFRVGAFYYPYTSTNNVSTHPVINVYCGGTLKATYGVEPQVTNFSQTNDFWKVVEVKWVGDYSSDECELTPKWNDGTGYVVDRPRVDNYNNW